MARRSGRIRTEERNNDLSEQPTDVDRGVSPRARSAPAARSESSFRRRVKRLPDEFVRHRLGRIALALAGLVVVIVAWDVVITLLNIKSFIVPAPADVARALYIGVTTTGRISWWPHLAATLQATLIGLAIGVVSGFLLGVLLGLSRVASLMTTPYVVGFQAVPKVAIAPIVLIWFGFGIESKIALAAAVCFFPVLVNTQLALLYPNERHLELMRLIGASRWQTFRWARLPEALPMVFAGIELAALYSLLGAIVGEFIGARQGAGVLLLRLSDRLQTAAMFAVFIILALIGLALHQLARMVGKRVTPWREGPTGPSVGA